MEDQPFQSLYRRYRPQRFAEVRGQDHVTTALRNAVRGERVAHAYLFSGPRGTGKTSTARILAAALNCANPVDGEPDGTCDSCVAIRAGASLDVLELDAASNNGVDAMRDLVTRAALGSPGRWKVYIVDEVHMLTTAASNALLKTLEEPPGHVVFVLATTDDQKVLPTIKSRTQHYHFRLLGPEVLVGLLADVNDAAGLGLDGGALDRVARRGNGSARDALSALDQAAAAGETADDEAAVVPAIVEAMIAKDAAAALVAVAEAARRGRDPHRLALEVIGELRGGFLRVMAPEVADMPAGEAAAAEDRARRLGTPATVRAMEVLGTALIDMRESLDTRVTLEVALVRLCAPEADTSPAAILERLEQVERRLAAGGVPAGPGGGPGPGVGSGPGAGSGGSAGSGGAAASGRGSGPGAEAGSRRGSGAPLPGAAPSGPPPLAGREPSTSKPTIGAVRQRPAAGASTAAVPDDPPPVGGALVDRDELTKVWGDRLFATMSPGVKTSYRDGRWASAGDGVAVFVVCDPVFALSAAERRPEVEAALAAHFGGRVRIEIQTDGSPAPPPQQGSGSAGTSRPQAARPRMEAPAYEGPPPSDPPGGLEDEVISSAEFARLDAAPDVSTSTAARLMEAFPGSEELPG